MKIKYLGLNKYLCMEQWQLKRRNVNESMSKQVFNCNLIVLQKNIQFQSVYAASNFSWNIHLKCKIITADSYKNV